MLKSVVPPTTPVNGTVTLPDCRELLAKNVPLITAEAHVKVQLLAGGGGKTSTPTVHVPAAFVAPILTKITPLLPVPL